MESVTFWTIVTSHRPMKPMGRIAIEGLCLARELTIGEGRLVSGLGSMGVGAMHLEGWVCQVLVWSNAFSETRTTYLGSLWTPQTWLRARQKQVRRG